MIPADDTTSASEIPTGGSAPILRISSEGESLAAFLTPTRLPASLWRHRALIVELARREIATRYKGLSLGRLWAFLNPVFLLAIYTFVFGLVLRARWPESKSDSLAEFAITLFCGISVFNVFGESATRAASILAENRNYVKRAVFPFEILPFCSVIAALFHGLVNLGMLVVVHLATGGSLHPAALAAPLLLVPLAFLAAGIAWCLASFCVTVRDAQQVVPPALTALFFLTPILYSASAIPPSLSNAAALNPLAFLVDGMRAAVLWGAPFAWTAFILCTLACACVMFFGYAFFMSSRDKVADAL